MKRKRWISIVLLILILFTYVPTYCETWQDARDHNRWTEAVLFGNQSYKSYKPPNITQAVECLEDALLLCIDQFNGYYKDKLEFLNSLKIPGIPKDISEIDFSSSPDKHRIYTHRGWNHKYTVNEIAIGHADIRKRMLYSVVDHVFDFKKYCSTPERAEKVCDSMCCLMYVSHVLADRYHSQKYYGGSVMVLLAEETDSIIHDLLQCLPVLFLEQEKERDSSYNLLISELKNLQPKILKEQKEYEKDTGKLLAIDKEYSAQIKDLLVRYIPILLKKQPWFTAVFPTEWSID